MDDGMKDMAAYRGLLRDVAERSDELALDQAIATKASKRALDRWQAQRGRGLAVRAMMGLAAAAVAAVLLFVAVRRSSAGPELSFVVGPESEPGKVGAWIASGPAELPLRFSEGTEITLQAGASARVSHADAHGADVLLERGALKAHVVHRDAATGWTVRAGPFEIHVVGTSFDAAWDPSQGALEVGVTEGRVVVTGPLLDEGRAVQSDEHLRVSLRSSRFEMSKAPTPYAITSGEPAPPATAIAAAPAATPEPPPADVAPSGAPSVTSAPSASARPASSAAPGAAAPAWRDLARTGQHRAALEAALAQGFDRVVSESSGAELLLLADSARFAGDVGHARQALNAARSRGEKGRTAFLLGKLAADSMGAPGEGAQWFEVYLREAPGGALAEQALGRLIELYRRTGQSGAARVAATKYVEKYPSGGYAGAARAVLDQ